MSKNWSENLTYEERADLARLIKPLRQGAGLSKKDVYDEARISRQTLNNIEDGVTVPQPEVLLKVLDAVGYETDSPQFEQQTEIWLTMIGTMIEAIPAGHRQTAADKVVRLLAVESRREQGNVTRVAFGVGAPDENDLTRVALDSTRIAATKDNTPVSPERGEK